MDSWNIRAGPRWEEASLLHEAELWRERREQFLREAEEARLVRQLRLARKERGALNEEARRGAWRIRVGGWVLRLERETTEDG